MKHNIILEQRERALELLDDFLTYVTNEGVATYSEEGDYYLEVLDFIKQVQNTHIPRR